MRPKPDADLWQASAARHQFSRVVDAAVAGRPQVVSRRDGQEVVVVSREYYERTKPTLKSVLLTYHFEPDEAADAAFDAALREARQVIGRVFTPRATAMDEVLDGAAGHRRSEPPAKRKKQTPA